VTFDLSLDSLELALLGFEPVLERPRRLSPARRGFPQKENRGEDRYGEREDAPPEMGLDTGPEAEPGPETRPRDPKKLWQRNSAHRHPRIDLSR